MKNFDESSFFAQWICSKCGYIYDENIGDLEGGIAPGTRFEDIPENWVCPVCGAKKSAFRIVKRRVLVKNSLIVEKNHLTNDVIELKVDLGEDLDYENGQFVNFVFNDEKGIIQRTYSIVSKENNIFTFLIKLGDGRGSLVLKNSRVGDNLGFTHISGDFLLKKSKNQKIFIASGTGLAPIFNMINSLNNEEKITLYFGVRTKKDLFYIDKLKNIKNLEFKVYLSREELEGYNFGRINLDNIKYSENTEFYICGNPSLLKDTKEVLIKQGYNNIYFEDYLN